MGTTVQCQPSSTSTVAAEKKLRKRRELDAIVAKARQGKHHPAARASNFLDSSSSVCLMLGSDDRNGDSGADTRVTDDSESSSSGLGFISPRAGGGCIEQKDKASAGGRRIKALPRQKACRGICGIVSTALTVVLVLIFGIWLYVQIKIEMGSFRLQLEQGVLNRKSCNKGKINEFAKGGKRCFKLSSLIITSDNLGLKLNKCSSLSKKLQNIIPQVKMQPFSFVLTNFLSKNCSFDSAKKYFDIPALGRPSAHE